MVHFCSALLIIIIQFLLLYLVIILLHCVTWVTATWEECCKECGRFQGNVREFHSAWRVVTVYETWVLWVKVSCFNHRLT